MQRAAPKVYVAPPLPSLSTSIVETNPNGLKRVVYTFSGDPSSTWFYSANGGVSYSSYGSGSAMSIDSDLVGYSFIVKVRTTNDIVLYSLRYNPVTGAQISFTKIGAYSRFAEEYGTEFELEIPGDYQVEGIVLVNSGDVYHRKISDTKIRVLGCYGTVSTDVILVCDGVRTVHPAEIVNINGNCQACVCACEGPTVATVTWYPASIPGEYCAVANVQPVLLKSVPAWTATSPDTIIVGSVNKNTVYVKRTSATVSELCLSLSVQGACSDVSQQTCQTVIGNDDDQIDTVLPNSQTVCSGKGFSVKPVFLTAMAYPVVWSRNATGLTGMPVTGRLNAGVPLSGVLVNDTGLPINVQFTFCRTDGPGVIIDPPEETDPPEDTDPPEETDPPVDEQCCQYEINFTQFSGNGSFSYKNCYGASALVTGAPGVQKTIFSLTEPLLVSGSGTSEKITCQLVLVISDTVINPCSTTPVSITTGENVADSCGAGSPVSDSSVRDACTQTAKFSNATIQSPCPGDNDQIPYTIPFAVQSTTPG